MRRIAFVSKRLAWLLMCAALANGCLVSFETYPVGDLESGTSGNGGTVVGGGSALGGATSSAGTSGSAGSIPVVAQHVIDDFEDGDHAILEQEGRHGIWFGRNDGT